MKYGSVCSGIEGASVAWGGLGWKPSFFSEIEPFPRSVLAHHYPDTPLHDDFTTIKGDEYEPIDLLVGGAPCQSFSIAGLRRGLDDDRGNLALQFLKLAQRTRAQWVVWENVPGVLSSNGGRDFGSFLGGLGELGYGYAYRVLDAQYFGVPQRRRRVFVVGYLGDWRPPTAALFERQSLSGHPAPRREKGQDLTDRVTPSIDASYHRLQGCAGQDLNTNHGHLVAYGDNNTSGPIPVATAVRAHGSMHQDFETETFIAFQSNGNTDDILAAGDEVSPTVRGGGEGGNPPAVAGKGVRRLSVVECERLQGFPDSYTDVPHRGKKAANGPRYKALGNSFAVPVVKWIGERIEKCQTLMS